MLKKYLIRGLLGAVIFSILIFGKVFYMQRSHYLQAEQHYIEADFKLATMEYDSAMHNYTPWSPYIRKSAERLWQIGEMFERKGKPDLAMLAYSSIRSSFYASRSLFTPGKEWIEKCDDKIASLNVNLLINDGTIKPDEADGEKKKLLFVMKADRSPEPVWSLLLEFSFFGWIASVVFILSQGIDEKGKIKVKTAAYGAVFFVFSFAIWVMSSLKA